MARTARVYVVDDDAGVLRALKRLLTAAGFETQTFATGREFLGRPGDDGPVCLVLDQQMPDLTGLQLQKLAGDPDGWLSIVFITAHGDVPTTVEAMKGGAVDFLVKPVEATELIGAVTRGLERSTHALQTRHDREDFVARLAQLTRRERQVGARVIRGLLNKQIAFELGTAEKTIKVHRARLMQKMHVQSVAELVRLTERANIPFEPEPEGESANNLKP